MKTACPSRERVLLLLLFLGSHSSLPGCSDPSKTSGTQVELSDEVKKQIKGKSKMYKAKAESRQVEPKNIKTH